MGIFSQIPELRMKAAAAALRSAIDAFKQSEGRDGDWSFLELGADEEDLTKIHAWLSRAPKVAEAYAYESANALDGKFSEQLHTLGILILMHHCLVARRDATEGAIWPAIRQALPQAMQEALFAPGPVATPTTGHYALLRRTFEHWDCLSVSESDEGQRYFNTIKAHIGWTFDGFRTKVGLWMLFPELQTRAMRILQDHSRSFQEAIEIIEGIVHDQIKPADALDLMQQNPFTKGIPPHDLDEALKKLPKGYKAWLLHGEQAWIKQPWLRWHDGERPIFETSLGFISDLDTEESVLQLHVDQEYIRDLWRHPQGDWRIMGKKYITLPARRSSIVIELKEAAGRVVRQLELEYFPGDKEISLYQGTDGSLVKASDKLPVNRQYRLIYPSHYALEMAPAQTVQDEELIPDAFRLASFRLLEDTMVKLTFNGVTRWQIYRQKAGWPDVPIWAKPELVGKPAIETSDGSVRYKLPPLRLRQGVRLADVRLGRFSVPFTPLPDGTVRVAELVLKLAPQSRPKLLLELTRDGERTSFRYPLGFPRPLFLRWDGDVPVTLEGTAVWSAARGPVSALTRCQILHSEPFAEEEGEPDAYLFEGQVQLSHLVKASQRVSLPRLWGWGEAVTLRVRTPNDTPHVVANESVDQGVFDSMVVRQGRIWLDLNRAIDLSPDHRLALLGSDGQITEHSLGEGLNRQIVWPWTREEPPVAVALTYKAGLLGSLVGGSGQSDLLMTPEVAAFLRRHRIPVLGHALITLMKDWARHHPASLLRGWLTGLTDPRRQEMTHPLRVLAYSTPGDAASAWSALLASSGVVSGPGLAEVQQAWIGAVVALGLHHPILALQLAQLSLGPGSPAFPLAREGQVPDRGVTSAVLPLG
ncbi:MAG: hypothetical protein VKP57_13525 [Candidatus Sericytochromatia bacterium]|nr:hypothetical protein [Candidatus Sericytochromatia bacterium]